MNIVKLKDILMPTEFKMAEFFNKHLKGKYAYWIQMRYIFPLDSLDYKTYIKYEQLDAIDFLDEFILPHIDLYSEENCMIDFANTFIDLCATEDANNIYNYIASNKYVTDYNIDIECIKTFRSWLAKELLKLNGDIHENHLGKYSTEQIHMLEYYKNCMYNDVIKYLDIFGNKSVELKTNNSSCGCCGNNSINLYDITSINTCDPKAIYIKNIHTLMVKTFEDPMFWINLNVDFIKVFKIYVDNIIKAGFVVNNTNNSAVYSLCNCSNNTDNFNNETILTNLSKSLDYIINKQYSKHMNFIHDSLYNWAEYLYDYMYWK